MFDDTKPLRRDCFAALQHRIMKSAHSDRARARARVGGLCKVSPAGARETSSFHRSSWAGVSHKLSVTRVDFHLADLLTADRAMRDRVGRTSEFIPPPSKCHATHAWPSLHPPLDATASRSSLGRIWVRSSHLPRTEALTAATTVTITLLCSGALTMMAGHGIQ